MQFELNKGKGREDYIEKTLSSGHAFAPSVSLEW
jgi:hypothetical protein